MKKFCQQWSLAILFFISINEALSQPPKDTVYQHFLNPSASAKPRVWWHWMNGNITKEGIRLDLLWMKRSGIGGFQNFDAALMTPQIVKKRLAFMTPEWKDAFRFGTLLADSLHLEMANAGYPAASTLLHCPSHSC